MVGVNIEIIQSIKNFLKKLYPFWRELPFEDWVCKSLLLLLLVLVLALVNATAALFSEQGYTLLLVSRNFERHNRRLSNAVYRSVDVNNYPVIEKIFNDTEKNVGPIECLINCAGGTTSVDNFIDQSVAEYTQIINTNILGTMNCIKATLSHMISRKKGIIFNFETLGIRQGTAGSAVYCAAKIGIRAFTEGLRQEVGKLGVCVIQIEPGYVDTPIWDN